MRSYARHGSALKAAAHFKRALEYGLLRFGSDEPKQQCTICLDSDPPPIQSGCACRSDTGLAHVGCLIEKAVAQQPHRGKKAWRECQTCGHDFTGAMRTGLAEAWWLRVRDQAEESVERLAAATNIGQVRFSDGRYAEAERIFGDLLAVQRRVFGEEQPQTMISATNLAASLTFQGKYAYAERIGREALAVQRRLLGDDHPSTLNIASNLAQSLSGQGKYAQAEQIEREVLGAQRRVLGEAHPTTRNSASNLSTSLSDQGKHAEAEEILQAVLAARRRVLGRDHPAALKTAKDLEFVQSAMRATQPTKKVVKAKESTKRGVKAAARAASALSPTELAEAEARAGEAEAELLAMLDLEEAEGSNPPKGGKSNRKASRS
jgi:hypothetical protein